MGGKAGGMCKVEVGIEDGRWGVKVNMVDIEGGMWRGLG